MNTLIYCNRVINFNTWNSGQDLTFPSGNNLFGLDDPIACEQLALMLWRFTGSPAATNKELCFNGAGEACDYALDALRWAVEKGTITGTGDGRLNSKGSASRAQVARKLMRYMKNKQR